MQIANASLVAELAVALAINVTYMDNGAVAVRIYRRPPELSLSSFLDE